MQTRFLALTMTVLRQLLLLIPLVAFARPAEASEVWITFFEQKTPFGYAGKHHENVVEVNQADIDSIRRIGSYTYINTRIIKTYLKSGSSSNTSIEKPLEAKKIDCKKAIIFASAPLDSRFDEIRKPTGSWWLRASLKAGTRKLSDQSLGRIFGYKSSDEMQISSDRRAEGLYRLSCR